MSLTHDLAGLLEGAHASKKYDAEIALYNQINHWLDAIEQDAQEITDLAKLLEYRNAVHELFHSLRETPSDFGEQRMEDDKVITEILKGSNL